MPTQDFDFAESMKLVGEMSCNDSFTLEEGNSTLNHIEGCLACVRKRNSADAKAIIELEQMKANLLCKLIPLRLDPDNRPRHEWCSKKYPTSEEKKNNEEIVASYVSIYSGVCSLERSIDIMEGCGTYANTNELRQTHSKVPLVSDKMCWRCRLHTAGIWKFGNRTQ